ncbi:hypothetical protein THAOC_33751, partial [Thalassiosira oceanica]
RSRGTARRPSGPAGVGTSSFREFDSSSPRRSGLSMGDWSLELALTQEFSSGTRPRPKTPALTRTFPKLDYDTKPKHESKARETGRAEETEMMGGGVEDHRTIELDVNRPADHDGATREA